MMLRFSCLPASLLAIPLLILSGASARSSSGETSAGVRSGTADVDGGSLYYEVAGRGEPLVLIHDGLLHREVYDPQFTELASRFTVVRYDRRGYGRSPSPQAPYSPIDNLLRILDTNGIESAHLMGASAGGRLAVDFTLAHPDRVRSLVLVGAVVSGLGFTNHFFSRGGRVTSDLQADRTALGRFYTLEDPYEILPGNDAAKQRAWALLQANPQNMDPANNRLALPPPRPAIRHLDEIQVPTLIVIGEGDIPDVHAHGGALEAGIAGARRILVRGAGHLVALERPREFTDQVQGFLRSADFFAALQAGDVSGAVSIARRLREEDREFTPAPEGELNAIGYRILGEGRPGDAVEIFRMNAEMYPDSWNVWDSLGEGQAAAGDVEAAIASYRRSLELKPDSDSGTRAIRDLEERRLLTAGETEEPLRFEPGRSTGLVGPYLGQEPPELFPALFGPGIVSTRGNNEFALSFSLDGKAIYFNRGPNIQVSRWEEEGWTAPVPVSFSSPALDHEAHITRDGTKLFFGSRRPRPGLDAGEDPYGIWVVERDGEGWGEPRYHGLGMYVTTTARGDIYVTDIAPPSVRGILRQRLAKGRYGPLERVDGGPNFPLPGAHPCVAPDESFLIFDVNPTGALTGNDLRVSFRQPDGTWGKAIDLGEAVNSEANEYAASLSPDGKYLFFSRSQDIYWVSTEILERLRPGRAGA